MNTELNQEQTDNYQRDGFIAHRGLLSADEVSELKVAVLEAVGSMGKRKVAGGGRNMVAGEDEFYDQVFTQRLNLWRINDTIKRYMLNSRIGAMMCALEGVEGFRVWHDQALIKEAYDNPTGWHLDNPFWSFSSRHAISIWIALEPATFQNGCMWSVPESHKLARFDNSGIEFNMKALFKIYPEMMMADSVGVPMAPGDCSFHNGLTAHGAGASMTRGRRIAMTCAYMPVGSTFNGQQNILAEDYFESLKEGDVLDNDDWNPVVFI
ncbi:MAG: phytanoyl-CoA dioxygenase family protein [Lentisphaerae bacterium]|nr:phytanoyl-CoA dioxygenase family protein [Lentisphaerota bacterium]